MNAKSYTAIINHNGKVIKITFKATLTQHGTCSRVWFSFKESDGFMYIEIDRCKTTLEGINKFCQAKYKHKLIDVK